MHPADCIKTIQQTQTISFTSAVSYIHETQGLGGFWNGIWVYSTADALAGAVKFGSYEYLRRQFPNSIAASVAFLISSVILVPGESLKQFQQTQTVDYELLDLYQGYSGVLLRDIPHATLELCLYDRTKRIFTSPLVSAGITGTVTAVLTTPLDTLKSQLVAAERGTQLWDVFDALVSQHGTAGLFAGVAARVAWIVPFTMIYLPTYDAIKVRLRRR